MDDGFSLLTDHHNPLLQLQSRGGGLFDGGTADASMMFPVADGGYAAGFSSGTGGEEQRRNKGKDDLFFCDLPELGGFDDLDANIFRNSGPTFEVGSDYFADDTPPVYWSSICSPVAHQPVVPSRSSCVGGGASVRNPSATAAAALIESPPVSVPDHHHQMDEMDANVVVVQQQQNRNAVICSSSGEINDGFSQLVLDAEPFDPFDDGNTGVVCEGLDAMIRRPNREMQVPTASAGTTTTTLPVPVRGEPSVPTSSSACCSGPDLVAADVPAFSSKRRRTPDMLLKGMAENPLEMYFPPLNTSAQTREEFAGDCAGARFCSKEMGSAAELPEQQTLILDAVPVKDLGFHKLQNGMNQMDVATKGRIRDALYRLANSVEQRHYYVAGASGLAVGASSSKRFRSGTRWTETQTNPMDQSVAQLLLQKPPYRNTVSPSSVT